MLWLKTSKKNFRWGFCSRRYSCICSCIPRRQTVKQPGVMNMLSYLQVPVNREVKRQEKQVLAFHGNWNTRIRVLWASRKETWTVSGTPVSPCSSTLHRSITGAPEKRKLGSLDSRAPNPHFSELLSRLLARPRRTPWKLVSSAPSRRHMLTIFSWSIKTLPPSESTPASICHGKLQCAEFKLTGQQEQQRLLITKQWVSNTAWGVSHTITENNWNLYRFLLPSKRRVRGLQLQIGSLF